MPNWRWLVKNLLKRGESQLGDWEFRRSERKNGVRSLKGDDEEKVALLLERRVEGMEREIIDGWLLKKLLVW